MYLRYVVEDESCLEHSFCYEKCSYF